MKRVIIVDDAMDLCRLFQDALNTAHPEYAVTVVPSGEEALLEATRLSFDLLVTDIRLPGMTGVDLARKIRVRQPRVKIFMMTGLAIDEKLKKQKDEINPDIFMRKPISIGEFLDAVEQLLEGDAELVAPKQVPPHLDLLAETPAESLTEGAGASGKNLLDELAGIFPGEMVDPPSKSADRKGTGGLGQNRTPPQEAGEEGVSAILTRVRSSLGAQSAILLDDRGHSVAQAGDFSALDLQGPLLSPLLTSLSAGAKIAYHLGASTSLSVQAYRGENVDLVIAPVGQYALLVALKPDRSALRLALAFEEALNAQVELSAALEAMGLRVQSVVEQAAPSTLLADFEAVEETQEETLLTSGSDSLLNQDPSLEKFEELFAGDQSEPLGLADPDSFWEMASGESADVSTPGVLSFEQARKLGLLPDETGE